MNDTATNTLSYEEAPQDSAVEEVSPKQSVISKVVMGCMLLLGLLLPLFFLPSNLFPLQFGKGLIVFSVVTIGVLGTALLALKEGVVRIYKSSILWSLLLLPLVYLISAVVNGTPTLSLTGQGYEFGTVLSVVVMYLLALLAALYLTTGRRVWLFYTLLFGSATILSVFLLLRFFLGTSFLSLGGLFGVIAANPVGKWYDLSIFFALTAVLIMSAIQFLSLSRLVKIALIVLFALSLFFLAVINFYVYWVVLGVFALVFAVYTLSSRGRQFSGESVKEAVRGPAFILPIALLLFSFFFGFANYPVIDQNGVLQQTIGDKISEKLNIVYVEVRPSWLSTFGIARQTLASEGVFGVGPNRFTNQWLLHKPTGVNENVFWATDFNNGIGVVPSAAVTVGPVGMVAWVIVLGLLLLQGIRVMLRPPQEKTKRFLMLSSFFGAAILWAGMVLYVPTTSLVALTFIFTGIFAGLLVAERQRVKEVRTGFVLTLLLIIAMVGSLALGYVTVRKFFSNYYFQKSAYAANVAGNLPEAEVYINRALAFDKIDNYYRLLGQIYFVTVGNILNNTELSADELRNQFTASLQKLADSANRAEQADPDNYLNYQFSGQIFEALIPLNIPGVDAYTQAKDKYMKALALNPHNPALYLTLARLEVANKDRKKAKEYIGQALKEKPNYTDAVFLLSQIQVDEGDLKAAIQSTEGATLFAPNDPVVFFQLGFLRYNNRDFAGARDAFMRAVGLNNSYANALYFLGLSFHQLGDREKAILAFEEVLKTNPDSAEVKLILTNLRAGRAPFTNAQPPVDDKPEKRANPPVKEKQSPSDN